MEMEEFVERLWPDVQEAFRRRDKMGAMKLIRGLIPTTMGLRHCKNYVERYWDLGDAGLDAMRVDFMSQLGINPTPAQEMPAVSQPFRVVKDENFTLTVRKEVTFDQLNEFMAKACRELGF